MAIEFLTLGLILGILGQPDKKLEKRFIIALGLDMVVLIVGAIALLFASAISFPTLGLVPSEVIAGGWISLVVLWFVNLISYFFGELLAILGKKVVEIKL